MMLTPRPQTMTCPACQVTIPLDVLLGVDGDAVPDQADSVEVAARLDVAARVLGLLDAARFVEEYQRTRTRLRAEREGCPECGAVPAAIITTTNPDAVQCAMCGWSA